MNTIRDIYIAPSQARKRAYFKTYSAAARFFAHMKAGEYTIFTLRHPESARAFGYRVEWDYS